MHTYIQCFFTFWIGLGVALADTGAPSNGTTGDTSFRNYEPVGAPLADGAIAGPTAIVPVLNGMCAGLSMGFTPLEAARGSACSDSVRFQLWCHKPASKTTVSVEIKCPDNFFCQTKQNDRVIATDPLSRGVTTVGKSVHCVKTLSTSPSKALHNESTSTRSDIWVPTGAKRVFVQMISFGIANDTTMHMNVYTSPAKSQSWTPIGGIVAGIGEPVVTHILDVEQDVNDEKPLVAFSSLASFAKARSNDVLFITNFGGIY